jgi:molybdate/tungstate transport system substrate-binding protein
VPNVAPNPEGGARWIEYMIDGPGEEILTESGLQPVNPTVVPESGADSVPSNVMDAAEAQSSLGPLEL